MKRVRALLVLVVALLVGVLGCNKFKASRELRRIERSVSNATTTEELEDLAMDLDFGFTVKTSKWDNVQSSLEVKYETLWNTELSEKLTDADVEKEAAEISSFKRARELYSVLDSLSGAPFHQPDVERQPAQVGEKLSTRRFCRRVIPNEENRTWIQKIRRQIISQARVYRREAPIVITSIYPSRPNSAGGVDVHITFINKSDKTIKYVTFGVAPYNAVGDRVSSEIGDRSFARLETTGPYKPGHGSSSGYWGCIWYNYSIRRIKLNNVEIEYMDGTEEAFFGGEWVDLLLKK